MIVQVDSMEEAGSDIFNNFRAKVLEHVELRLPEEVSKALGIESNFLNGSPKVICLHKVAKGQKQVFGYWIRQVESSLQPRILESLETARFQSACGVRRCVSSDQLTDQLTVVDVGI